jgi:hypothetical protein
MPAFLRLFPLLLLALLAACDRAAPLPAPSALEGRWLGPAERWSDGWSPDRTERRFTFGADGTYTRETVSFGGYGRPAAERTYWHRVHGDFRVEGGRLWTRERRRETWDAFHGADAPVKSETVDAPRFTDAYGVALRGDSLTLHYVTHPADAPVDTRAVYRRVPRFE